MKALDKQKLLHYLYRFRWPIAFAISMLLHLALLGVARIQWPDMSDKPLIIEAQLKPLPKPIPPPAPAKRSLKKPAKPAKLQPRPIVQAAPQDDVHENANTQSNKPAEPEPLPFESGVDLDTSYQFEQATPLSPPQWVETEYEVKRLGFGSGLARYRFQRDHDTYLIQSEMEASGLATLAFSGKRIEKSSGVITSQGLKPSQYRYEISNKKDRFLQTDFDWNNGRIYLKNNKEENTVPLQDGTIDVLSFLYQFMFVGPLDEMHYNITNGKTVRSYEYHFLGEEIITSSLGQLNTLHIAKSSGDPDEKTEVWLATDYRFIPVKILKIAKDGTGFEFLVSRIDADFNHEHQP